MHPKYKNTKMFFKKYLLGLVKYGVYFLCSGIVRRVLVCGIFNFTKIIFEFVQIILPP